MLLKQALLRKLDEARNHDCGRNRDTTSWVREGPLVVQNPLDTEKGLAEMKARPSFTVVWRHESPRCLRVG